jgi:hypothetical protein
LHDGRHVGTRRNLGEDALDFALAAKSDTPEQLAFVFGREVGADEQQAREMQGRVGEHVQRARELPNDAGCAAAPPGFVLRQTQFVRTVTLQRRAAPLAVSAAGVDLGEMSEQ